jgi:hypothetical protein
VRCSRLTAYFFAADSLWHHLCRSSVGSVSYAETTKVNLWEGSVDQGIEHFVLNGGSQLAAAEATKCCSVAMCRAIKKLKEADAWDEHVMDIQQRALAKDPTSMEGGRKRELEMPTPKSLGKQIKAGANRLGDGRPYGNNGSTPSMGLS